MTFYELDRVFSTDTNPNRNITISMGAGVVLTAVLSVMIRSSSGG